MFLSLVGIFVMSAVELPTGAAPPAVSTPYFPDKLHAFVWRNWQVVSPEKMADVVGAAPEDIVRLGKAMGLYGPPKITKEQEAFSTTTIIRRNWQLLPYEQLLKLLGWTPEEMAYHLREDDFLYIKLGSLKPKCEPIVYAAPDEKTQQRENEIAAIVKNIFPQGVGISKEPPLGFMEELKQPPVTQPDSTEKYSLSPRFCFSYFGLTGDPFLGKTEDLYPDGYLARLAARGVDGVWLQGVLYTLAPFPWEPAKSDRCEERLENLNKLIARAKQYGIGVYLYLNEPRAMPPSFFEQHPDFKGVSEGDYSAMCTSNPEVQKWIRDSVAHVCKAVPDLRGFFSITASENLTNCWSHFQGANCPRCSKRQPQEVIAEVNALFQQGIQDAGSKAELIAWDWCWPDAYMGDVIKNLPKEVSLMSVSEWSIPIERGGVSSQVGEYSISTIGPGPRALQQWKTAKDRGMRALAKIQAGTTWEIGSMPYVPAVMNVAEHIGKLREQNLDGVMLSWTLGGYPSPNLEVVAEMSRTPEAGQPAPTPDQAMTKVAERNFGPDLAPHVVDMWREISLAFREYPYSGGLIYVGPQHVGPANPLWESPTNYKATMVGFPYDDLESWRAIYPENVFIGQFMKMADGFDAAVEKLQNAASTIRCDEPQLKALNAEIGVASACAIHWRSSANQAKFVIERRALADAKDAETAKPHLDNLRNILLDEMSLAERLFAIQSKDSRIGFEASNQYFYLPMDLVEKTINCRDLLSRWIPAEMARFGIQ